VLFNSQEFAFFFLPITLVIFLLIRSRDLKELSFIWLALASLFFYGWWEPKYLVLILASIAVNFAIGKNISFLKTRIRKKFVFSLGIIFNLALLGFYKYANFTVNNINAVAGTNFHLDTIILPLAISFFTFQQIAYLVDAYNGETKEYNFTHYCLFVTFFPQLIAGPIVHHKEMMPQFMYNQGGLPKIDYLTVGVFIFVIGLFKKIVIADSFAPIADNVFNLADAGENISTVDAWVGALSYTFQLYFDFSGYSDMAIGAGRMFGIHLPQNFNSPYQSTSIIEFWRRWHMTLSSFLRDYLYIPLGGNRHGELRRYVNLFITMLLGGLWHGAGWNFLLWGLMHGVYLVINNIWSNRMAGFRYRYVIVSAPISAAWTFGSWLITFVAVVFAWVLFRATSFQGAYTIMSSMAFLDAQPSQLYSHLCEGCQDYVTALTAYPQLQGIVRAYIFSKIHIIVYGLVAVCIVATVVRNSFHYTEFNTVASNRFGAAIGLMAFVVLLFVFARMANNEPSPFLYFQF